MKSFYLDVALSDTNQIVRAADATPDSDYLCPRCGMPCHLLEHATASKGFLHPPTRFCSPGQCYQTAGLLVLQQSFADEETRIQLLRACAGCVNQFVLDVPVKEHPTRLLRTPLGVYGLLVESFEHLFFGMRPLAPGLWGEAAAHKAFVVEVDGRNAVSGGPIVSLRSSLPKMYSLCHTCKLRNRNFTALASRVR